MNLQMITGVLDKYKWLIAIVLIILVLTVLTATRQNKKRRLRKRFDALEVRYNELMSIPVLFKINKSAGLAKLNPKVESIVEACRVNFNDINKDQETIVQVLADTEDALAYGKIKETISHLENLEELVTLNLEKTYALDQELEKLLEQETEQRSEITRLKERFRSLKQQSVSNAASLGDAQDAIQDHVRYIERAFSNFEEWMYASDFQKAKEVSDETREEIELLEHRLIEIPKLYEIARGHIPSLLDEISKMYYGVRQSGVYVDHLEVPKTLGVLSEVMKDDLINLGEAETEKTRESLSEVTKRLEQMGIQIQKESKAHDEVQQQRESVFDTLDGLMHDAVSLKEQAAKVEKRFGFAGYEAEVEAFEVQIQDYNALRLKIQRMIEEEKLPATTVLISLSELGQDVAMLKEQFDSSVDKVEQANADEIRAQRQLMKLYLINNDVQVRIKKRSLPIISEKYADDLKQAKAYTDQIADMLQQEVLDVAVLNETVDEAIDYVYKLHNNVNNLVGVVDMCENAIVYANKYRAYVSDIDAELTRAELSFNSGEYTQALTTVINAIDRYKPNTAYEEMIRDNAKSAR